MTDKQTISSSRGYRSPVTIVPVDILVCWFLLGMALLVGQLYPGTPLQAILAAPVLFLLPGYVTVGAVVPHHHDVPESLYSSRVTIGERFALSFALSIVLLALLGLVVGALPWGYSPTTLGGALGAYVLSVGAIAGIRHLRMPAEHRFGVPVGRWASGLSRELRRGSAVERVVTLALCVSVLLAVGVAGYALAVPNDGESFTDLHLVTEDGDNLVAGDYQTELTRGEPAEYTVGVQNYEGEPMEYEVVVTLDRVVESEGQQLVIESDEIARFEETVEPGEQWTETHEVETELTGEDLRLTYHLYVDQAPDHVDVDDAYRHVHLWVDVTDGE